MQSYLELAATINTILTLALSGAVANPLLRGSDAFPGSRYANAALFGLEAFIFAGGWKFSILMALAMAAGQSFAIPHNQTINGNWKPMFFRGMLWVSFLVAVITVLGFCPIWYTPTALSMYLVYHGADQYFLDKLQNAHWNQVRLAETIYGILLWTPIAFVKYSLCLGFTCHNLIPYLH